MGFSKTIRDEALALAARHCCVCHRYKGLAVEVHHIVQLADNGSNLLENAIALCLDCHLAAGHYNVDHPKGSRYSKEELRIARDKWFAIVRQNAIPVPVENRLHCRYLLARSFSVVEDIALGRLENIPFKPTFMHQNRVVSFFKTLCQNHSLKFRDDPKAGRGFQTEEEYVKEYPDAQRIVKKDYYSESVTFQRDPTSKELLEQFSNDSITKLLISLKSQNVAQVDCYGVACAGPNFQDHFYLRPAWPVFLIVENISEDSLSLEKALGREDKATGLTPIIATADQDSDEIRFPKLKLKKGESVLIPLGLILPNKYKSFSFEVSSYSDIHPANCGQTQYVSLPLQTTDSLEYELLGPKMAINEIRYDLNGQETREGVHSIDWNNVYRIDRVWECGSCPFAIFISENGDFLKAQELFNFPGRRTHESISCPEMSSELIIAELEKEVTTIKSLSVNKALIRKNLVLKEGDYIRVKVQSGDLVEIDGMYNLLLDSSLYKNDLRIKKRLLERFQFDLK